MLQQPTAATPAEPLESLSFPDMREVEAVLSPQDVNKGLAQADPLTRHPRVSSIVLCVVFGLLMLAASAGVWWLGVRTMDGQSYEDIVWSKFDAALPGWLAPVVHVFAISAVVITVSVIMGAIAFAVLIVRKRWLSIAQLAVFGGLCFAAAELLKPFLSNRIRLEPMLADFWCEAWFFLRRATVWWPSVVFSGARAYRFALSGKISGRRFGGMGRLW